MTNLSILKKFTPFYFAPLILLAVGCGTGDPTPNDQGSAPLGDRGGAPAGDQGRAPAGDQNRSVQPFVPASPDVKGRDPGGRPRTEGGCAFGGFTWQDQPFAIYPDEQACIGDQWVRYDERIGLWVGLTTCSIDETRIYLSASPDGPFFAAADYAGHGQDHCELVNSAFTLTDEDDITSGGCTNCSTGINLPLEGVSVYGRGYLGDAFEFVETTPEWSYQVSRLRCGVEFRCEAPPSSDGGVVINDCAGSDESAYVAPGEPGDVDLVVVGVYETRSDHGYGYHPTGAASVSDTRSKPHVLVLSSYEPTHWTIDADESSGLLEVILNGYHDQTVSAPDRVKVSTHSGVGNYFSACGYFWPNNDGGCDTPALVSGAESFSGLPLSSFNGCYRATNFEVRDAAK